MTKSKESKELFITKLTEGQKHVIDDKEHRSKALMPIQIDTGNLVEVVQVDNVKWDIRMHLNMLIIEIIFLPLLSVHLIKHFPC